MKKLYENLPETPGVYFMKDGEGKLLYIGKAANLKKRVSSYFLRPHEARIQRLVSLIRDVTYKRADTALEALILEAELIKKHQPPFNVLEKDDKTFLYIEITKEELPRVLLVRGKDLRKDSATRRYGPFTSSSNARQALGIIRKIFPFHSHATEQVGKLPRPCFDYEIGLCPGVCVGAISKKDYANTIRNLRLFFEGKKDRIIASFTKDMHAAAKRLDFEKAADLRRRLFALQHIQDIAFIGENEVRDPGASPVSRVRLEGYDISNISGTSAVGSMVVFINGKPARSEYRKFKIRSVQRPDDVKMLQEVLRRRFNNSWELPDYILVDGGLAQVHAARKVLDAAGLKIPVFGMAKGPARKRTDIISVAPKHIDHTILVRLRDEAHRFAIRYHRTLRRRFARE